MRWTLGFLVSASVAISAPVNAEVFVGVGGGGSRLVTDDDGFETRDYGVGGALHVGGANVINPELRVGGRLRIATYHFDVRSVTPIVIGPSATWFQGALFMGGDLALGVSNYRHDFESGSHESSRFTLAANVEAGARIDLGSRYELRLGLAASVHRTSYEEEGSYVHTYVDHVYSVGFVTTLVRD